MTQSEFATLPATATRDALRIEYRWIGTARQDAPLAVFLHEGLGSVAMWKDWPAALCERLGMRGLVYSRPGYGRSTPRAHDTKWPVNFMSHQARDVLPALLDALDIGAAERARMWLVGHSDGASITLLHAAAFPDAIAGAIVIAPHVFVEDISVTSIAEAKVAYETTSLRDKLARYHDDVDSAFYGWNDIWLDPAFRAWNIVDEIGTISAPLLAVQAHDDHYGTMAQVEAIGNVVKHARVHALPHGGHSPHRDAPQLLDDVIVQFIASHRASAA
ncbi:alpha/beta fold hydrolase [Paraburkholderia acidisoli]|uniref:Alpha/beta fold hydrolase n=1 Tax=Paraburkholderia acidisoli TaxID=2571748 RepID=A0A7Z2GKL9_9BURK|nr:alpha/beta hydrolase [Paraburkholderia acidisoli]QGZ63527.1 alpha/beta fold hydrolase [Paraburkholderia acidisoli]